MLSRLWDARTGRVLFTALLFLLALGFLRGASGTLTLFLLAILFTYLVAPVVSLLQKPLRGRGKAILFFYLFTAGVLVGFGYFFGSRVVNEGRSLIESLPALVDRMASGQFIITLSHNEGWDRARQTEIQQFFMGHRDGILTYAEDLAEQLKAPLYHIWWLILVPILGVFFLRDGAQMAGNVADLGRDEHQMTTIRSILGDIHGMLGGYIRAQLILSVLTAIVLTIVLGIMRVPYSFILSPLAGICEFIPVVGPAVACIAVFGVAGIAGYNHLVWLFLFLGTWRIVQDYLNAPRIMGKSVEISPLAEIFGVLAGGEIGGVMGALVAVPVLAMLHILWRRSRTPRESDPTIV